MRVFIAIDVDEQTKKTMGDLQLQLESKADIRKGDVKWVGPEAMHFTLKFLGEIKDEKVAGVCNAVEEVVGRHKSFELDIESVGCFGGKAARVVWVGTGEGSDELLALQKDIEKQLASAGWPEEGREFTGHLTICRVKNSKAGMKLAKISEAYRDFKVGSISADSVHVYQSELTPKGPIYTVLCDSKLK